MLWTIKIPLPRRDPSTSATFTMCAGRVVFCNQCRLLSEDTGTLQKHSKCYKISRKGVHFLIKHWLFINIPSSFSYEENSKLMFSVLWLLQPFLYQKKKKWKTFFQSELEQFSLNPLQKIWQLCNRWWWHAENHSTNTPLSIKFTLCSFFLLSPHTNTQNNYF